MIKKILTLFIGFGVLFSLVACGSKSATILDIPSTIPSDTTQTTDSRKEETMKTLELKIGNTIVNVIWEDNASVDALKKLAKDGLTISMHEYGGFEQTGPIGSTLPSLDKRIDVVPGDVVLYNSNQISIFYNNSSWSYTKLGHINMSNNELKTLLDKDNVTIKITDK